MILIATFNVYCVGEAEDFRCFCRPSDSILGEDPEVDTQVMTLIFLSSGELLFLGM